MRLSIRHSTSYVYDVPPLLALQRLRLGPPSGPDLRVHMWRIDLEGAREEASFVDGHGNSTMLVSSAPNADAMTVTVTGDVETLRSDGVVGTMPGVSRWLYRRTTPLTAPGVRVRGLATHVDGTLASLHDLTRRVREAIDYRIGETDAETTAEAALAAGTGVCQDHAHAFCAAARVAGVPARYVSGYLRMDDREEQDAMHAWAEAFVDGLGWVGFDPANGYSPDERYVAVARGLDYRDAAPVQGLVRGIGAGERTERMDVSLVVRPLPDAQSQQQQ